MERRLAIGSCIAVSLSIMLGFVSNYFDSKVMGNAALGVAVLAGDEAWMDEKRRLRRISDSAFYLSMTLSGLGVALEIMALRKAHPSA